MLKCRRKNNDTGECACVCVCFHDNNNVPERIIVETVVAYTSTKLLYGPQKLK